MHRLAGERGEEELPSNKKRPPTESGFQFWYPDICSLFFLFFFDGHVWIFIALFHSRNNSAVQSWPWRKWCCNQAWKKSLQSAGGSELGSLPASEAGHREKRYFSVQVMEQKSPETWAPLKGTVERIQYHYWLCKSMCVEKPSQWMEPEGFSPRSRGASAEPALADCKWWRLFVLARLRKHCVKETSLFFRAVHIYQYLDGNKVCLKAA